MSGGDRDWWGPCLVGTLSGGEKSAGGSGSGRHGAEHS